MPSFDVVSRVDMQEVDNAVNQAKKELETRYDFRGSTSKIELNDETITLNAEDSMKLKALAEILTQKMAKRGVGLKALDFNEPESAHLGTLRQKILIKQGIKQEDAKKITKLIKESNLKKIQAQIQGDQVRISGAKKDDLQEVMSLLKQDIPLELQFVNFKD